MAQMWHRLVDGRMVAFAHEVSMVLWDERSGKLIMLINAVGLTTMW